jgi:hypothetical protein
MYVCMSYELVFNLSKGCVSAADTTADRAHYQCPVCMHVFMCLCVYVSVHVCVYA